MVKNRKPWTSWEWKVRSLLVESLVIVWLFDEKEKISFNKKSIVIQNKEYLNVFHKGDFALGGISTLH